MASLRVIEATVSVPPQLVRSQPQLEGFACLSRAGPRSAIELRDLNLLHLTSPLWFGAVESMETRPYLEIVYPLV